MYLVALFDAICQFYKKHLLIIVILIKKSYIYFDG